MFQRFKLFIQDSRREFKRVNWPTRQQTIRYTLIVIGLSVGVSLFLGIFDILFSSALKSFVL